MKTALSWRLRANAALVSLVADRITPGRRDQGGALPAVVYHQISAPVSRTLAGRTALIKSRIQIDCWGRDEDEADLTAVAVKAALLDARFTHSGTFVLGVFLLDESDDGDSDAPENPFRIRLDFRVHHQSI